METTYKTTEGITDTDINLTDTTTGTQETTLTTTTILNFNDSNNCYIADDGYMYILADDVARELGFDEDNYLSPSWNRINKYLKEEGYESVSNGVFMHEYAVLALAMRANTDKAKEFRRTVIEVIIPYFKAQVSPDRFVKMKQPKKEVEENRAEANYPDDVEMNDPSTYDTAIIAKDYGWSDKQLYLKLWSLRVICPANAHQWIFLKNYDNKGYAVTQIETKVDEFSGEVSSAPIITRWTKKGKEFIYQILKEYGILPVNEDKSPVETETDHDDLKQDFVRHDGQTSLPVNEVKSPVETEATTDCLKQGFHQESLLSNYVFVPTATPFGMGFRQVYLPNLAPGNKPVIVFEDQKYNGTLK